MSRSWACRMPLPVAAASAKPPVLEKPSFSLEALSQQPRMSQQQAQAKMMGSVASKIMSLEKEVQALREQTGKTLPPPKPVDGQPAQQPAAQAAKSPQIDDAASAEKPRKQIATARCSRQPAKIDRPPQSTLVPIQSLSPPSAPPKKAAPGKAAETEVVEISDSETPERPSHRKRPRESSCQPTARSSMRARLQTTAAPTKTPVVKKEVVEEGSAKKSEPAASGRGRGARRKTTEATLCTRKGSARPKDARKEARSHRTPRMLLAVGKGRRSQEAKQEEKPSLRSRSPHKRRKLRSAKAKSKPRRPRSETKEQRSKEESPGRPKPTDRNEVDEPSSKEESPREKPKGAVCSEVKRDGIWWSCPQCDFTLSTSLSNLPQRKFHHLKRHKKGTLKTRKPKVVLKGTKEKVIREKVEKVVRRVAKKAKVVFKSRARMLRAVWNGALKRTAGGLSKDDLCISHRGRIVPKRRSAHSKRVAASSGWAANWRTWCLAHKQIREEQGLKGFVVVRKEGGSALSLDLYLRVLERWAETKATSITKRLQLAGSIKKVSRDALDAAQNKTQEKVEEKRPVDATTPLEVS